MIDEKNQIIIRPVEPDDIEIIYKWENDPKIWHVSQTLVPFSKHIIKQFIENSHLDIYTLKQVRFMIDLKNREDFTKTIGTIDLFDFDSFNGKVGIGILIKEDKHRQKGYASKALQLLLDYTFNTLMMHQVYCNISVDNLASIKLFEKHKFKITGKKEDWLKTKNGYTDEYLLQLINPTITN